MKITVIGPGNFGGWLARRWDYVGGLNQARALEDHLEVIGR